MKKSIFLLALLTTLLGIISCGDDENSSAPISIEELENTELMKGSAQLTIAGDTRSFSSSNLSSVTAGVADDSDFYTLSAFFTTPDFLETWTLTIAIGELPGTSGTYTLQELESTISYSVIDATDNFGVFNTIFSSSFLGNGADDDIPVQVEFLSNGIRVSFDAPSSTVYPRDAVDGFIQATF